MNRFLTTCAILAALSGCNVAEKGVADASTSVHGLDATTHALGSPMSTIQTFWVLDAVSVINTQKTIDDHIVSWISGNDCSTVKASMGEAYCQEVPAKVPTVVRTSYCYKNLASISCYDKPLNNGTTPIGTRVENIPVTGP